MSHNTFRNSLSRALAASALLGLLGCITNPAPDATDPTLTARSALSTCRTFPASGDAMLSNPPMSGNFGALPILRVGGKDEALVRFDLGSIPSSAAITSATLKLYIVGGGSDAPLNLHRATTAWSESDVTFASFAQRFDPTVVGAVVAESSNVQKSVDVTALVKAWSTGAQLNNGVLLETASQKKAILVSREGGTVEQKPALEICYTVPDDHCSPNPCANGGACENGAASFTCHCPPGWTGATCDTRIDNCASAPCQNGGACTNGADTYSCACAAGYAGTNCETLVDNCAPAPCLNGGICQNGIATYVCQCQLGYTGTNCETLVDSCASAPCVNGGMCTNGVDTYGCSCPAGFTGANCEIDIDDCAAAPCHNGGTCLDGANSYTCACPPDRGGPTCDINLSSCSQNPCLNGATCTNGFGTYTCTCAPGFTGANCGINVDDCTPAACQNGGLCVDGVNSHACVCPPGFLGPSCQYTGCAGAPDGLACDDANACTQTDVCLAGACRGSNPVSCTFGQICVSGACITPTPPIVQLVSSTGGSNGQSVDLAQCGQGQSIPDGSGFFISLNNEALSSRVCASASFATMSLSGTASTNRTATTTDVFLVVDGQASLAAVATAQDWILIGGTERMLEWMYSLGVPDGDHVVQICFAQPASTPLCVCSSIIFVSDLCP